MALSGEYRAKTPAAKHINPQSCVPVLGTTSGDQAAQLSGFEMMILRQRS
jgi:hypothetical protein